MMSQENSLITCKPCLAIDTLCALAHNNYFRREGELFVRDYFNKVCENIELPNSVWSLSKGLERFLSLNEIEKLTVLELKNFYIDNPWLLSHKENIEIALKRMVEYDFEKLWYEHCYDLTSKGCDTFLNLLSDVDLIKLKQDIQKIKRVEDIGSISVYLSLFARSVSYALNTSAYVMGYILGHPYMEAKKLARLLIHELCHGFTNEEVMQSYKKACESDSFLHQTHWFLINCNNSNDEEELVVAIEHFLTVSNGLETLEQAKEIIFKHYGSCMPVSVILFDCLMKEKGIPTNINDWIVNCFNKQMDIGNIKKQANVVFNNYSNNFNDNWNDEKWLNEEKRKSYKPLKV